MMVSSSVTVLNVSSMVSGYVTNWVYASYGTSVVLSMFTSTVEAGMTRPARLLLSRKVSIVIRCAMFSRLLSGVRTGTASVVRFEFEGMKKPTVDRKVSTVIVVSLVGTLFSTVVLLRS